MRPSASRSRKPLFSMNATRRAALLLLATPAFLQNSLAEAPYPNRPIRFVVPFPAGSGAEAAARFMGKKITEITGQPVIVDPRGGGNGFIGVQAVLTAPPDGYTLFFGSNSTLATNVALYKKLPYDPLVDFVPISLVMRSPIVLLTSSSSPYKRLDALVEAAQRTPGQITIGTGSAGYLLMAELFAQRAGIKYTNVPYKSAPETVAAVISGQVDLGVVDITSAMPLIRGGRASALAIAAEKRTSAAPEVPTTAEAGISNFTSAPWNALAAPEKVPKDIVDTLSDLFVRILAMPDTQKFFADQHVEVMRGGQAEMRLYQRAEIDKWKKIALEAKVQLQ